MCSDVVWGGFEVVWGGLECFHGPVQNVILSFITQS